MAVSAARTSRARLVEGPTVVPASGGDAGDGDTVALEVDGPPGTARPFTVHRAYTGPSGRVIEQVAVLDADGNELAASPAMPLTLHGPETPSGTTTRFDRVPVPDARPVTVVCRVEDAVLGDVEVPVTVPGGGDLAVAARETMERTLKKSTIIWVAADDPPGPTRPAWFVVDDGRVYVLTGPNEQDLVGLPEARRARLLVRSKDVRSLVGDIPADVERVPADDPRFDRFLATAVTRRLNLPDGDAAAERWRREATLLELTPRLPGLDPPPRTPIEPPRTEADETTGDAATDGEAAAAEADAGTGGDEPAEELDREVYERLLAEGKDERVARSKAKAALVRARRKGSAS